MRFLLKLLLVFQVVMAAQAQTGGQIAFVAAFVTHNEQNASDIFLIDTNCNRDLCQINLTNSPHIYEHYFQWSPDGTKLLISGWEGEENYNYYLWENGRERLLITNPDVDPEERAVGFDWSPDGSQILFYLRDAQQYSLLVMNSDTTEIRPLTAFTFPAYPYLSPDWTKAHYYISAEDGTYQFHIFDITTGQDAVLFETQDRLLGAFWRPDSKRLIFRTGMNGENLYNLYSINIDGSDQQHLFQHESITDITISPDGSQILFVSNTANLYTMYIMEIDGQNLRRIIEQEDKFYNLHWSQNGIQIVYMLDDEGQLYLIDADGTDIKKISNAPGRPWYAEWRP